MFGIIYLNCSDDTYSNVRVLSISFSITLHHNSDPMTLQLHDSLSWSRCRDSFFQGALSALAHSDVFIAHVAVFTVGCIGYIFSCIFFFNVFFLCIGRIRTEFAWAPRRSTFSLRAKLCDYGRHAVLTQRFRAARASTRSHWRKSADLACEMTCFMFMGFLSLPFLTFLVTSNLASGIGKAQRSFGMAHEVCGGQGGRGLRTLAHQIEHLGFANNSPPWFIESTIFECYNI